LKDFIDLDRSGWFPGQFFLQAREQKKRWAVEGVFYAIKPIAGESLSATKTENIYAL